MRIGSRHALCLLAVALAPALTAWHATGAGAGRGPRPFELREKEIGELEQAAQIDRMLARRGHLHDDEALQDYVRALGRTLVPPDFADPRIRLEFLLLRSPEAGAFALPNGSVYVSLGLLALLENEAQLAFVLAHEITHVTRHHYFVHKRVYKGRVMGRQAFLVDPSWFSPWNSFAHPIAGEALYAGTLIGYSRELEEEADRISLSLGVQAGYEAAQMPRVFERLLLDPDGAHTESKLFYGSDPKLRTRIGYTRAMIAERGLAAGGGEIHAERYLEPRRQACLAGAELAVRWNLPRTAIVVAEALLAIDPGDARPGSARAHHLRAEGYRTLGHQAYEISAPLSRQEKRDQLRERWSRTPQEIEAEKGATEQGRAAWAANRARAMGGYERALQIDPGFAGAHRGRALVFAADGRFAEALAEARRYLELAPPSEFGRPEMERLMTEWEAGEDRL
jgi:tetratricopeptide (TPR) repeat protein